jgi:hypothetical protein
MLKKLLLLTLLSSIFWNCRKEPGELSSASRLEFSRDTIFLDTVFTTIGSSTRILKVKNPSNEDVLIPKIRFGRGPGSFFRMNVNGLAGKELSNVEILGKDSLYVLIEVTADVMGAPDLLYIDSLVFELGGSNQQDVKLVTLAKDAHFHLPNRADTIGGFILPYKVIRNDTTWTADLPHVVYGYVLIDENATLTIDAGCDIHFHAGSGIIVGGSLQVDPIGASSYDDPVTFQGDRLEPWYEDVPGQWGGLLGGILILGNSQNNLIQNALIKNASIALRLDSNNTGISNMSLKNTRIYNSSRVGIYGGFGHLEAENVVVANSGLYNFYALGGRYAFRHSTFGNYWPGNRSTPSIGMFNFFEDAVGNIRTRDLIDCYFGNCIIYGALETEILVGESDQGLHNYLFQDAILKAVEEPEDNSYDLNDPTHFVNILLNEDPVFVDYFQNNYDLDTLSPAMDEGNLIDGSLVPLDIQGELRSFNGLPDLGAYERIE